MTSKLKKQNTTVPLAARKQSSQQVQTTVQGTFTSMPLYHPELLKRYYEINPEFAERMMAMGEKEQESRIAERSEIIEMEKKKRSASTSLTKLGLYCGLFFGLCILGLISYVSTIRTGYAVSIALISAMGVLIAIFVLGKKSDILFTRKNSATESLQKANSSEESTEPHSEEKESK